VSSHEIEIQALQEASPENEGLRNELACDEEKAQKQLSDERHRVKLVTYEEESIQNQSLNSFQRTNHSMRTRRRCRY
jgi:phosphoribosylaminoimidazole carboxylase (NCAIR synthetase)